MSDVPETAVFTSQTDAVDASVSDDRDLFEIVIEIPMTEPQSLWCLASSSAQARNAVVNYITDISRVSANERNRMQTERMQELIAERKAAQQGCGQ
jgi:hypothetical protein